MSGGRFRGAAFAAVFFLTLGCGGAQQGEFVLTDQCSGLPILSCSVPHGWMAGGKVMWLRNLSQPVRYYAIAADPSSGEKMILGSTLTLLPKNPYTRLEQAADITVPSVVGRRLTDEIVGLYGIGNVRVSAASFSPYDAKTAKPVIDRHLAEARRSHVNVTQCNYGLLRLRYSGKIGGHPRVVNCLAPYLLLELNGVSSIGQMMSVDSVCTEPGAEKGGVARMEAFARTRRVCPAFELYCSRIIQNNTMANIRTQGECLDLFLRTTGENSRRISAANARWCDAIRGEERVVNPHTGQAAFVSTQYDHCSFGANGEVLYWNGEGRTAGFNPSQSAAFGHTTWATPKSVR